MFKYTEKEIQQKKEEKRQELNNLAIKELLRIKGYYKIETDQHGR